MKRCGSDGRHDGRVTEVSTPEGAGAVTRPSRGICGLGPKLDSPPYLVLTHIEMYKFSCVCTAVRTWILLEAITVK